MEAYIAALVSCFCSGAFYLIDMIMKKDTFTRASQPMFISSASGLIPALLLFIGCAVYGIPSPSVLAIAVAFGSGVLLTLGGWIYFKIIYSNVGECTEVSAFETSSVIAISLITFMLHAFGVRLYEVIQLSQWFGVILTALALVLVHMWGDHIKLVDMKHRLMLILFTVLAAVDEMSIDWVLNLTSGQFDSQQIAFIAISPYHWMGVVAGVFVLISKKERSEFRQNFKVILRHWRLIVVAELIAAFAFTAKVYGFATGHVAVIAVMAGGFPIVVFFGGILLRRKFGFSEELFPVVKHPWKKGIAILIVILGITLAAWT